MKLRYLAIMRTADGAWSTVLCTSRRRAETVGNLARAKGRAVFAAVIDLELAFVEAGK